ncbi:type II toxin-antitoxin system ParD family antitoxin [Humitalea sp. 24SJ18S-53]|uniref:type II toxin-antitoxin system ParD family antitoxin n=1 Tax=Humitalea sp. 24SJ18S-53 TaxID=3422307 RepID=UPI003D66564F
MPTRNVVVTEHQAVLIDRLVASGRYQNASEVLRSGLRLVEVQEADHAARLQHLLGLMAEGEADLAAGRAVTLGSPEDISAFLDGLVREQDAAAG